LHILSGTDIEDPLPDDWRKVVKRKTDPRLSDTRITRGSGNVFIDLGFEPAEARIMALRAEVMIRMEQHLKAQGWTQAEAAKRLGITQPRVSRLIKGQWQDFSLDMLLTLAARAGLKPQLRLAA
jgi:predicted XRE-type DNA-binding protein